MVRYVKLGSIDIKYVEDNIVFWMGLVCVGAEEIYFLCCYSFCSGYFCIDSRL